LSDPFSTSLPLEEVCRILPKKKSAQRSRKLRMLGGAFLHAIVLALMATRSKKKPSPKKEIRKTASRRVQLERTLKRVAAILAKLDEVPKCDL